MAQPSKPVPQEPPKLWAAISISYPVFDPETWTIDRPKVHLGLVNDGTQALETGLRESVLLVNGQPRRGEAWDAALKKGLSGITKERLSPGDLKLPHCSQTSEFVHGKKNQRSTYFVYL